LRIWTISKHSNNVNYGEIPFLFIFIPFGANLPVFKQFNGGFFSHGSSPIALPSTTAISSSGRLLDTDVQSADLTKTTALL
jgi:hypothetical protein